MEDPRLGILPEITRSVQECDQHVPNRLQANSCVVSDRRLGGVQESGYVDPVQFKLQLDRCGLLVDSAMNTKLLYVYQAREGPHTGLVHYSQFVSDLRTASQHKYGRPAAIAAQMLLNQSYTRPGSPPHFAGLVSDQEHFPPRFLPEETATAKRALDAHAVHAAKARQPAVFLEPQLDRITVAAPTHIPVWRKKERPSSKGSVTFYDGGGQVDAEGGAAMGRSPMTSLAGSGVSTPRGSPIGSRGKCSDLRGASQARFGALCLSVRVLVSSFLSMRVLLCWFVGCLLVCGWALRSGAWQAEHRPGAARARSARRQGCARRAGAVLPASACSIGLRICVRF